MQPSKDYSQQVSTRKTRIRASQIADPIPSTNHRMSITRFIANTSQFCVNSLLLSEILRRGRSRRGRCANLSQIERQICAKLPVFRFVHQRKGAQRCRKFVANSKVNFGQFYANTLFQCPLLRISATMAHVSSRLA